LLEALLREDDDGDSGAADDAPAGETRSWIVVVNLILAARKERSCARSRRRSAARSTAAPHPEPRRPVRNPLAGNALMAFLSRCFGRRQPPILPCESVLWGPKCASGNFFGRHGGRAFFEHPQAVIASRKKPSGYDERASATAFYTYVGNDPTDHTDPTGMVCNAEGTLCTSDVAPKSTSTNVQNTPATDKAMHDNAGEVRVGSSATHEKIGFIHSDDKGNESFRNPSDAQTGSTATQDNARATVQKGDVAVEHSHIPGRDAGMQDDTNHGRSLGDAQPLKHGLTNGTVMGDRLGVHEQAGGVVQFRMIDGKMTSTEQKDIQRNLDDQQKLLNQWETRQR
jgi:hypothetical protein